jgi:hypothetical protein
MKFKFEFINGYGVLVDREAEIKKDEFYISWEDSYTTPKWVIYCKSTGLNGKNPMKIIFAEKELGLDVPTFEWRNFEVEKLAESSYGEKESDANTDVTFALAKGYINGFKEGYKSNPAKFTEEDLRKITQAAFVVMSNPETVIADFDRWFEKRLQSLEKTPKYVVMEMEVVNDFGEPYSFDDIDFGVEKEYRPKLFTNSDGKQQGVIKELIWT